MQGANQDLDELHDSDDPDAPPPPAAAAAAAPTNDALARALAQLATALNNFNPAAMPAAPAAPAAPLLNPFSSNQPFDLSTRSGLQAFTQASAALDDLWDGTVDKFPSFVIALRVCSREVRWNAPAPQGILQINGQSILDSYHNITKVNIEAARVARVNPRAVQNSRAMYNCIKTSITGDLKALIYSQDGNLPDHEDGLLLFKTLTDLTMSSSLQLSNVAFKNILNFDPSTLDFVIPNINTKLNHLFVLASTQARQIGESERIQHTLTTYGRIRQPEEWAQWIRTQFNKFDEGGLTNCQDFMNKAVLQYNRITNSTEGGFKGSSNTVQEDIVAMIATAKKRKTNTSNASTAQPEAKKKLPPFARHYKTSQGPDAKEYKVGDTKVWNNQTWYFCDAPTHKDKIKWHTHSVESCRTRKNWLASKSSNDSTQANNAAVDEEADPAPPADEASTTSSSLTGSEDITGLLAHALNMAEGSANDAVKDIIADAINALQYP